MKERILLEGPPGSGKSEQLLNVAIYLRELGTQMYVIDLEDKLEAMILNRDDDFSNTKLSIALSWDEESSKKYKGFKQSCEDILSKVKPGDWIGIDRVDLAWSMVQRWFTKGKYGETLADKMMAKSKDMTKKSMFIPVFDQGSWLVINEQYDQQIINILYESRCNVIMTCGIKGISEDTPADIGRLGVLPRGQKELGHQPHSIFLLRQKRIEARKFIWTISTEKDLKKRTYFDDDELFDFSQQYLAEYYNIEDK